MKTLFSILAFAVASMCAKAQPYESIFGQTSTQWVIQWSNTWGPMLGTVYIEKDTPANGFSYNKLSFQHPTLGEPPIGLALLREDTAIGKVWYKGIRGPYFPDADTTERLMFDFSLQAGDSFDISNQGANMPTGSYPSSWNIVDSVSFIAGRKHIYFRGACNWPDPPPYEPLTFIEGIGCNVSPMLKHRGSTLMLHQYTLCTYKDSAQTFYTNRRYSGNCTLPVSVTTPAAHNEIIVSPNPASEIIQLYYPTGQKLERLTLFDANGRWIVGRIDGANELRIAELPPGVYVLQINLHNQSPVYRRVVIQ